MEIRFKVALNMKERNLLNQAIFYSMYMLCASGKLLHKYFLTCWKFFVLPPIKLLSFQS